jgi:branched-subunit amino acid ABC-type transport system permease component
MEPRKLPLQSLSSGARIGLTLLIALCAYAITFLTGITSLPASILVSTLIAYLFYPSMGKQHIGKTVVVVCVAAFLIISSLGAFGTRQDFVAGFRDGWNHTGQVQENGK